MEVAGFPLAFSGICSIDRNNIMLLMVGTPDERTSVCFKSSVKEFYCALHRLTEVIRNVVVISFVFVELYNLIGFQHFSIEHFRELPGNIMICGAVVYLNGSV